MTEWVGKWKKNGWQTVNNEAVKNKEDIQRLHSLCQNIDVKWVRPCCSMDISAAVCSDMTVAYYHADTRSRSCRRAWE